MIGAVLKKELIENLGGFRFWAGCAATLLLAGVISWATGEDYQLRRSRWQQQDAGYREVLREAHTYSEVQPTLVRSPEPLSVLEPGFDARLGTEVRIVPFRVPFAASGASHGNELMASAPAVGLTSLVGLVLGFFALLLTFDSFSREREHRGLRLLESQGLSLAKLLLGKYLAGILVLCLPLALALGVAGERLLAQAGPLTGEQWLRVAGLFAACLGYLSCATLWGLAFSLRSDSRTTALARAVEAWLLTSLILPALGGNTANDLLQRQAERWRLEKRAAELVEQSRNVIRYEIPWPIGFTGHSAISTDANAPARMQRLRFGSPQHYDQVARCYVLQQRITDVFARDIAAVDRQNAASDRLGERFFAVVAATSPRILLDRMAQGLAGTAYADHRRFLADSRSHHLRIWTYFDRIGAFGSWQWFTDDSPDATFPWPGFLKLTPDQIPIAKAELIGQRLDEPAIYRQLRRRKEAQDANEERRVDLSGLPSYSPHPLSLTGRLQGIAGEGLLLLAFHGGALIYIWRGLRRGVRP